jgi:hypothetical protein
MFQPGDRIPILQARVRIPADCDEGLAELIRICVIGDPAGRPTAAQVAAAAKLNGGNTNVTLKERAVVPLSGPAPMGA